jgi:DNA repair exonuclease SbcCD nuclease subunit
LIPVLLAHWSVSGANLPNGLPVDQLSEPVIPWIDIDTLGWKLCALGHIHQVQVVGEDAGAETPIFYTGSACVGNLGEISGSHGVWIYDSEPDELRFVPVADRPFVDHTFEFGPDGVSDSLSLPAPVDGAVVRVRYRANGARVDEAEIRRVLSGMGAHKVFVKEIDRAVVSRARVEHVAEDVSVADALSLYVEASGLVASRNGDGVRFLGRLRERHMAYVERLGA